MDQQAFGALVARLDQYAQRAPGSYRARVVMLALLGYVFLLSVLAALLALAGVLVWLLVTGHINALLLKLMIPILLLAGVILRSMYVVFTPPAGLPVSRADAPPLFAMLDELSTALGTTRFDQVLIDTEFNAAVAEVPRLGIFGWPRHYLVLGLPLMTAVTPAQLRAVIAHEFGHRSGRHGRIGGWIYRLRATWSRLFARLEQEKRAGAWLFTRFFGWYAPYFEAYSFVLARRQEYEADRLAAELTSARDQADALVAIEVRARFFQQELWGRVQKLVRTQPEPPTSVYPGFANALAAPMAPAVSIPLLSVALSRATSLLDTHPALADRLKALGVEPPPPDSILPPPAPGAATALLGGAVETLSRRFDEQWRAGVEPLWHDQYRRAAKVRGRLDELAAKGTTLSPAECRERAFLADDLDGGPVARPFLEDALAVLPDDAQLRFTLGRSLLEAGDAAGIAQLESAAARDPLLVLSACELLVGWYRDHGDAAGEERWTARHLEQRALLQRAAAERQGVTKDDETEPHGLAEEVLEPMRLQLRMYDGVERAWLMRKRVRLLPGAPYFILLLDRGLPWWRLRSAAKDQQLVARVAAELAMPGEGYIVLLGSNFEWLGKRARKMGSAARIFGERD